MNPGLRASASRSLRTRARILSAGRLLALAIPRCALRSASLHVRGWRSPFSATWRWRTSMIPSVFSLASSSSEKSCGKRMSTGGQAASRTSIPATPSAPASGAGAAFPHPGCASRCSGVEGESFRKDSLAAIGISAVVRRRKRASVP